MAGAKFPSQDGWLSCFHKQIASPAWTLPLAILAPVAFMLSNNWFMYSLPELAISFSVLLMVCSLVFVTGKLVCPWLESKTSGKLKPVCRFMFCILFVSVLLVLLELPLSSSAAKNFAYLTIIEFVASIFLYFILILFITKKTVYSLFENRIKNLRLWHLMLCVLILIILLLFFGSTLQAISTSMQFWQNFVFAVILLCLVVMQYGFKPIRLFLAIWIFMSAGTGVYSAVSVAFEEKIAYDDEHIILKNRPNIYLFLLESYHDLETMQTVYGIDTEPLQSFALSRDFFIYGNTYSNSYWTLLSMAEMFEMRLAYSMSIGNDDIMPRGRRLIGGSSDNQVYRILKENGYRTTYLTSERPFYYINQKGIYLDDTDVDFEFGLNFRLRPLQELFPSVYCLCKPIPARFDGRIDNIKPKYRNALIDNIRSIIEKSKSEIPLFLGFKSGALHASHWKQKDEWVASGRYQEGIKNGNQEIFEIVDLIVDKDPSAVIVLIGDHGATRLRNIWDDAIKGDIASLDALLKQRGESLDTLASDMFGMFLAIRMPGKGDISNGLPMSHVNLFRHIFAALADDGSDPDASSAILQRRAPSESNLDGFILVRDGVVQHPVKP
ncbi:MAG: hypothetical protein FWH15_04430 [Betaproteobacteria bacterium]|nr:hypothetical protein [Betaproteobacteria bacterium]